MPKRINQVIKNVKDYDYGLLKGQLAQAWSMTDRAEKSAVAFIETEHKKASDKIINQSVGFVERYGTYEEAKAGGRLNKYFDAVDDELKMMAKKQSDIVNSTDAIVFKRAYNSTSKAYGEAFGVSLGKVSKNAIAAFDTFPVLGVRTKAETANQYSQAAHAIRKEIRQGLLLGESPYTTGRRIATKMNINRNHAMALARTNIVASHNRATEIMAQKNRDLFTRMRWITQLDERTCQTCGPRHGNSYPIGQVPYPAHFNCRCAINPIPDYRIRAGLEGIEKTPEYKKEERAWKKEYATAGKKQSNTKAKKPLITRSNNDNPLVKKKAG